MSFQPPHRTKNDHSIRGKLPKYQTWSSAGAAPPAVVYKQGHQRQTRSTNDNQIMSKKYTVSGRSWTFLGAQMGPLGDHWESLKQVGLHREVNKAIKPFPDKAVPKRKSKTAAQMGSSGVELITHASGSAATDKTEYGGRSYFVDGGKTP